MRLQYSVLSSREAGAPWDGTTAFVWAHASRDNA
jgi:hypothetical protein